MNFPRVRAKTIDAHEVYHNNTYLLPKDIQKLFACSPSTASKVKRLVKAEMAKRDVKIYSENANVVDRDILFELAGLDISKIDKSYRELMRYEK